MAEQKDRFRAILVVDDEVIVRIAIAEDLRDAGFTVAEARDGAEALLLLESGRRIDAVFSDVNMPGPLSGLLLAERIGAAYPGIPVVLTSGSRESAQEARRRAIPFVAKPYLLADILAVLETVLQSTETGVDDSPRRNGNTHGGGR